jgi:hypothetical protein
MTKFHKTVVYGCICLWELNLSFKDKEVNKNVKNIFYQCVT